MGRLVWRGRDWSRLAIFAYWASLGLAVLAMIQLVGWLQGHPNIAKVVGEAILAVPIAGASVGLGFIVWPRKVPKEEPRPSRTAPGTAGDGGGGDAPNGSVVIRVLKLRVRKPDGKDEEVDE